MLWDLQAWRSSPPEPPRGCSRRLPHQSCRARSRPQRPVAERGASRAQRLARLRDPALPCTQALSWGSHRFQLPRPRRPVAEVTNETCFEAAGSPCRSAPVLHPPPAKAVRTEAVRAATIASGTSFDERKSLQAALAWTQCFAVVETER